MAERGQADLRAVDLQSQVAQEVQSHHFGASLRPPGWAGSTIRAGFALRSHPLGSLPASQSPEPRGGAMSTTYLHSTATTAKPIQPPAFARTRRALIRLQAAQITRRIVDEHSAQPTPSHGRRPAFARLDELTERYAAIGGEPPDLLGRRRSSAPSARSGSGCRPATRTGCAASSTRTDRARPPPRDRWRLQRPAARGSRETPR